MTSRSPFSAPPKHSRAFLHATCILLTALAPAAIQARENGLPVAHTGNFGGITRAHR